MKRCICLISIMAGLFSLTLSCSDDMMDTSFLVGQWDVRIRYVYREDANDEEYRYNSGDFFYRFDGKYFTIGGAVINYIDVKRKYVYDKTTQTLSIEDDQVYKVLELTETDLILESSGIVEGETIRYKTVLKKTGS